MAHGCVGPKELQQSDNEILISLVKNYLGSSPVIDKEAAIRFRPPYMQTTKHDARGDAVALIVEHLHQRFILIFKSFFLITTLFVEESNYIS